MRIATWNINSIRTRLNHVINFIKKNDIDVMCLQETKTTDEFFPINEFRSIGLTYYYFRGEKSYNGVAILSKYPLLQKSYIKWCNLLDTRHLCVQLKNNIILHNFYVPAGGDVPDINLNNKFKHKIKFLKEMISYFKDKTSEKIILLGDLNIAPGENDVWSHKQLNNVVSHTPIEIKYMYKLIKESNLYDVIREKRDKQTKIYTWWSYRSKDWKVSNRGRRLDHVLISKDLIGSIKNEKIYVNMRDLKKPSDHVPISIDILNK